MRLIDAEHLINRIQSAKMLQPELEEVYEEEKITMTNWLMTEPTAQQWIPCSERLPEGEVLCCDVHQNIMIGYVFASEKSDTGYSAESEQTYMYDCVAWMPLPKSYRGDEA